MIFEAPFELDNYHIRQKLSYYGKLKDQEVYQHKYPGLEIYNGIPSINFLCLNKPLPTTIYVQGNRIKLKHIGKIDHQFAPYVRRKDTTGRNALRYKVMRIWKVARM